MTKIDPQIPAPLLDMPFSQEAEEAVIGSILFSARMFPILQMFLRPHHFFLLRCRIMWQAFNALVERGDMIDETAVIGYLEEMGTLEDMGMYAGVTHFLTLNIDSMNAEAYGRIVHTLAMKREMHKTGVELCEIALSSGPNIDGAINRLDRKAQDLRRELSQIDSSVRSMEQVTRSAYDCFIESHRLYEENPNYVIGIRTGVHDLDRMLDGLRPGVTTLAAGTGVGKTALALQVVRFASSQGILRGGPSAAKVHFFSGEMIESQLINRMVSAMTGIPVRTLERGSWNKHEWVKITDALHEIEQNHRMTLEANARMNTAQIRNRVRTMVNDNEMDLLVLDGLLQIEAVKGESEYKQQQRRDFIEVVMNELEDIAITYRLPILMTHQLSRAPGSRQNKRPILSDLAEASFVEQKSAVILFLYREGYYDPICENPNAAEIIVAKNRHGGTGTIDQIFDAQFTRFVDADRVPYSLEK
jgi:replicative DNA helicase